jgi:flavin reductase (DIM6/NTAB) family NADH-FMN oxidoreductase RutF
MAGVAAPFESVFRDAMASLASGVAVLTSRHDDGEPCGLVATSLAAYSATPPSLLVSIGHVSRCYHALADGEVFGVHLLAAGQERLAGVFADAAAGDKFATVGWHWDGPVPALADEVCVAYLRCRRAARFDLYDHTILIGDVEAGRHIGGDPLLYLERQMGWRLSSG